MSEATVQFIPFVLLSIITLVPAISICGRIGKTRRWAALALIPFAGPIILLYVFAYSRWVVTPAP